LEHNSSFKKKKRGRPTCLTDAIMRIHRFVGITKSLNIGHHALFKCLRVWVLEWYQIIEKRSITMLKSMIPYARNKLYNAHKRRD
jgi:hypothetical protein